MDVKHRIIMAVHGTDVRHRGGTPVTTIWSWTSELPVEIVVEFQPDSIGARTWMFARTILDDGLLGSGGIGDIRVRSDGVTAWLKLASPDGWAELTASHRELEQFLSATVAHTPIGAEAFDLDGELAKLLAGA